MESTAPPEPAGRDVGPFRGVTTVRVHGGYEICRGRDERGRKVTILTMGPSAAKNPGLRDTLRDAYDWVRIATGGRDEFLGADLAADQPWIASLDGTTGVRRLFDRVVSAVRPPAPGRHTGQLPRITDPSPPGPAPRPGDTGQLPRVGDTGQLPRVTDTGHIPRVVDTGRPPGPGGTGQFPRVPAAPPGRSRPPSRVPPGPAPGPMVAPRPAPPHRPPVDHTGQLPRITDPTGRRPGSPPPTARELTHQPLPAYQGPAYTAAPRPIAPPPASALPARPADSHGMGVLTVFALAVIVIGAIMVLITMFVELI